jgi:hypothetical protein
MLGAGYTDRVAAEIKELADRIPHQDSAIQWDAVFEFLALAGFPSPGFDNSLTAIVDQLANVGNLVPSDIELGYHFCYGDLDHKHTIEPHYTAHMVDVANGLHTALGRPLQFIHLPVPRERNDDSYFSPLERLRLSPETEVYLGLVHHSDGLDGALQRITAANRHIHDFGIATECGFGRRSPDTLPDLLKLHKEIASSL